MRPALLLGSALIGAFALAQAPRPKTPPPTDLVLVPASHLESILQNAPPAKDSGKPGDVSSSVINAGNSTVSFIRLSEPDLPHVHPVSEYYIMKAGSATLETGGTMIGPFTNGGVHHQAAAAGGQSPRPAATPEQIGPDHGGTALEGGHSQQVKAGDVLLIPAGLNHHWTKIDEPIVYLDIKFPKAE